MVGKATKSSIAASTSANKDLSCLRCRKKKAKCSKTRPTCTRCSRSNQPCEYPDAPPNLTDLSQKVLTLYDTLRELEGEFLVKYIQTMDEDTDTTSNVEELLEGEHSTSQLIEENETQLTQQPYDHANMTEDTMEEVKDPAGWSMSLTSNGLSIQTATRNLNEFNEFCKLISRQVIRDFGPDYLPKLWDPDAEGYFEEDSDAEELDEDEYLVTVPVFSTFSLLFNGEKQYQSTTPYNNEDEQLSKDVLRTLLNGQDTLVSLIQSHYLNMIQHLNARYKSLEEEVEEINTSHHIIILMFQLRSYLPSLQDNTTNISIIDQICILTAYVVSVTLLSPSIEIPPLPTTIWRDCSEYATMLLIDLILSEDIIAITYPILLCCVLISWIDVKFGDSKADTMIHIGLRVLCGSNWEENEPTWQMLIATLLYLDIYSATFKFKRPQLRGEDVYKLWKSANQMRERSKWDNKIQETGIVLESRLMYLLNKVIILFYGIEENLKENDRKIDVDEVFTLVREVELWEQELPEWAKWNNNNNNQDKIHLRMHMHMIHNIVKILLFRPFCSCAKEEDEQTFTKTSFLDMSISSADRLTTCLNYIQSDEEYWTTAANYLVKDVSNRVLKMFNEDEQVVKYLQVILDRLESLQDKKICLK